MNDRPRFWRWYRTLPILSMALMVAMTFGLLALPSSLVRRYLLPIHHEQAILDPCARHGVDPLLVCAIIQCESGWEEDVVSDAGAVGLMQMMPSTSQELSAYGLVDAWAYDPNNLTDPVTNIEFGCAYLAQLQGALGSQDEVIAAYNAGPGSVESWLANGGDITEAIDFPETALYLTRVKETYSRYNKYYDETLSER